MEKPSGITANEAAPTLGRIAARYGQSSEMASRWATEMGRMMPPLPEPGPLERSLRERIYFYFHRQWSERVVNERLRGLDLL